MPTFGTPEEKLEIEPTARIFIESRTPVLDDDGNVISHLPPHRRPIEPEADVSAERDDIKAIALAARTPKRMLKHHRVRAAGELEKAAGRLRVILPADRATIEELMANLRQAARGDDPDAIHRRRDALRQRLDQALAQAEDALETQSLDREEVAPEPRGR